LKTTVPRTPRGEEGKGGLALVGGKKRGEKKGRGGEVRRQFQRKGGTTHFFGKKKKRGPAHVTHRSPPDSPLAKATRPEGKEKERSGEEITRKCRPINQTRARKKKKDPGLNPGGGGKKKEGGRSEQAHWGVPPASTNGVDSEPWKGKVPDFPLEKKGGKKGGGLGKPTLKKGTVDRTGESEEEKQKRLHRTKMAALN